MVKDLKRLVIILSALVLALSVSSCTSNSDEKIEVHVEGVELSKNEITLCADTPDTAELAAAVFPQNADIKDITWSSGNESIAHVDADGNVYPCGVGTAEIIARTADGDLEAKCAVTVTASQIRTDSIPTDYTDYDITLYDFVMLQMTVGPVLYDTKGGKDGEVKELNPPDEEVEGFANPENFLTGYGKNQFLVLNEENGIDAETLNKYLNGKGALSGKGKIFKKAAQDNNISEVFLTLMACVRTQNGSTELASGTEIKGETVYNLFGIGTQGSDDKSGARFAFEQGWTSIDKAIEDGAKWLSENYLNNPRHIQNTLYKMRWNPETPGANQYTADVQWADNVAHAIAPMLDAFPKAQWRYDIPVFEAGRAVAG